MIYAESARQQDHKKIINKFSVTVVRFVEMNFEQFHQLSQPYAFRVSEKFSTL